MSEEFELDELMDEMVARIEDAVESAVEDQVTDRGQCRAGYAAGGHGECFADFEFVLPGGTIVRPRQYMKLLSPDKTKLLLCYGGLKVKSAMDAHQDMLEL